MQLPTFTRLAPSRCGARGGLESQPWHQPDAHHGPYSQHSGRGGVDLARLEPLQLQHDEVARSAAMNEPQVLVWLLMEQDGGVLLARRKAESRPLAGQWVLPGDRMTEEESSSETIWRVGREMLDIQVIHDTFVDTLYIKDNTVEWAVNVFSIAFEGAPRYRQSGPYAEVRWVSPNDLPRPINDSLAVLLQQEGSRPPRLSSPNLEPQVTRAEYPARAGQACFY